MNQAAGLPGDCQQFRFQRQPASAGIERAGAAGQHSRSGAIGQDLPCVAEHEGPARQPGNSRPAGVVVEPVFDQHHSRTVGGCGRVNSLTRRR